MLVLLVAVLAIAHVHLRGAAYNTTSSAVAGGAAPVRSLHGAGQGSHVINHYGIANAASESDLRHEWDLVLLCALQVRICDITSVLYNSSLLNRVDASAYHCRVRITVFLMALLALRASVFQVEPSLLTS